MKKHSIYYLIISLGFIIVTSCTQNTYDDIEADEEPIPDVVTYLDVKPAIDNNCLNCHSNPPQNGAPMSLLSYENVVEAVLDRGLLDRISKNEGEDGMMPLGGPRLPQATIDLIYQWQEDGLLEN